MTCHHRALLLSSLAASLAFGGACARSDMGLSLGAGGTGGTTQVTDTSGTDVAGTTGASGGTLGGQGGSTMVTGGGGAGGGARSTTYSTAGAGGTARSSTPTTTAPVGGRGGAGGIGGAPGTGGAGGAGGAVCSEVTCLSSLFARCQPTGTCTVQEITTAANPDRVTTNYCFSDGSKEQYIEDYTDNSVFTTTVKRNNATCYSLVKTEPADGGTPSYVFQNAGGSQVATATQDASGVMTVTCNGGKATKVSAACSSYASTGPDITSCDDGNCTY